MLKLQDVGLSAQHLVHEVFPVFVLRKNFLLSFLRTIIFLGAVPASDTSGSVSNPDEVKEPAE